MLIGLLAANISFVDFDDAGKLLEITAAGFPQPVQNEPGRLLRDPDSLASTWSICLCGRDQQIHRVNPLMQRNVGALEDRSGSNREIFLALIAAIEAAIPFLNALAKTQIGQRGPLRPEATLNVVRADS